MHKGAFPKLFIMKLNSIFKKKENQILKKLIFSTLI